MGELYDLLVRAGFSADDAQEIAGRRGQERMAAGEVA